MVYSSDMVFCDECDKYDVQQSLNTTKYDKKFNLIIALLSQLIK